MDKKRFKLLNGTAFTEFRLYEFLWRIDFYIDVFIKPMNANRRW